MNKVITINLNGKAYQIEEEGYALLHSYLAKVRHNLNDNPDQDEIIKDFEQAIAEKCDKYISAHKNVVGSAEVKTIIAEMGPIEGGEKGDHAETGAPVIKRLYRIREGAWIAGVCNGIATFFGMDVKIVRIIFIVLSIFTHGGFIGLYILMAFFVPAADTLEERAYAQGKQFNTQEFIEEMKAKYGKYTEEGYWKKYADSHTEYAKKVGNAWVGFTRIGTGIFTFLGTIALIGIGIVYSIMMWGALVDHHMFGNKFLIGASPILLALFITACVYIISWPIRKMVNEARRHTWNITGKKHPVGQIISLIIWLIAIGFAAIIGIKSLSDQHKTYAPYGTDFWIAHHEFCIGGNYFCDPTSATENQNEQAVRDTVQHFGETLQQVSLLAPAATLKPQMEKVYGSYLTPELLKQWQNNPDIALGRQTSSPYPDHISIDEVSKNEDGSYTVTADIIEMTSNPQDHFINAQPVTFTVVNVNNEWRISATEIGKY
ncbi:MAG: phage shock protein PspC [Candidatus Nomurabacteria bacterium]|nr:phage shock protein PspC [Candidatus Nomurabacteria bacterium]